MDDSKYKIILVGCGKVAQKHLKAVRHLKHRLEIMAVVDPAEDSARALLTQELGTAAASIPLYPSWEAVPEEMEPDIVAITTPSGTHYKLAEQAICCRCNVLIEKPMSLDVQEARHLLELAEEYQVSIAMGHIYRYFPLVDLIHDDIASGKLGKVYSGSVQVYWGHDQDYYDQALWRGTWAQDGGALMNQTIHACDLMCWLMDDEPVAVNGQIRQLSHDMEAEDHGVALLSMSTGALCTLEGTTNNSPRNQKAIFRIVTEEAEFHAGLIDGKVEFTAVDRFGRSLKWAYYKRLWKQMRANGLRQSIRCFKNPHTGIYLDLIHALDEGRPPRADGESGLQSVETMLAIYQSASKDGETESLPLDNFTLSDMEGYFDHSTPVATCFGEGPRDQ